MSETRFRLPPEVFDALHLSVLANGGIGPGYYNDESGAPLCVHGHISWLLDTHMGNHISEALRFQGLNGSRHDELLRSAGVTCFARVPFRKWCNDLGVDVEVPS